MKAAIMQPYFFPYIGYWQLLNSVDTFVIYDNIQYTKKGWINRNRFLQNGKDRLFSIPLKKDSDFKDIRDRVISNDFNKKKMLDQIVCSYRKAPYFKEVYPLIEDIIINSEKNLFNYIFYSIKKTCKYLGINTSLILSSSIDMDHSLKAERKVMEICKKLNSKNYINTIGGKELYNISDFNDAGINLNFIKTKKIEYKQFDNEFVPWLSIIDVMMFNSKEEINRMLGLYFLE
jgi:hypothetical protein